jgi:hypothetical protein
MYSLSVTPVSTETNVTYAFEFYIDDNCDTSIGDGDMGQPGAGGQCINEGLGNPSNPASVGFNSFTITTTIET